MDLFLGGLILPHLKKPYITSGLQLLLDIHPFTSMGSRLKKTFFCKFRILYKFVADIKLAMLFPHPLKESNLMKLLLACFSQTELYIYKDLCFHEIANYNF